MIIQNQNKMSDVKMHIHQIKCIDDLDFEIPIEKGLYAITGKNGSGKSTIATCAASLFFQMRMQLYFGVTEQGASITFEKDEATRSWCYDGTKWLSSSYGDMNIKGFYEGSLIFGNRFKDVSMTKVQKAMNVDVNDLVVADDFIRENLGLILQGNEDYYEKLYFLLPRSQPFFDGYVFYYVKNGRRISQFHMSTGENLLISVLNSIHLRNNDRANLSKPCVLFLDEIELALHPSSLKRLLNFLQDMSERYNYAIYFSTHSIELISAIKPDNIFYVERHSDNSIEILNPCYPAYATRMLYDHTGFDNVILVEDDLAAAFIKCILQDENLQNNRMIHVLPCGGYANVIKLAAEVVQFNILGKRTSVSIILDGDVKLEANNYILKNNIKITLPLTYLPIESLEKYLRNKLYVNVDHGLYRYLTDYIFQVKSIDEIIEGYEKQGAQVNDDNGKNFWWHIEQELKERRSSREEIIRMVVNYVKNSNNREYDKIRMFLKNTYSRRA